MECGTSMAVVLRVPRLRNWADRIDRGGVMSLQSHIEALKDRHATLESRISDEDQRPRPDSETLSRLKLEKLRLKEEMERLQHRKG
jgi:hypothetical protein